MVKINWTKEAEEQLAEIYNYISKDNPDAASKVVNEIYKKVQILKDFPEIGYKYQHTSGFHIRILLYGHYRIAYWIKSENRIDILGVFHGALELKKHLKMGDISKKSNL